MFPPLREVVVFVVSESDGLWSGRHYGGITPNFSVVLEFEPTEPVELPELEIRQRFDNELRGRGLRLSMSPEFAGSFNPTWHYSNNQLAFTQVVLDLNLLEGVALTPEQVRVLVTESLMAL